MLLDGAARAAMAEEYERHIMGAGDARYGWRECLPQMSEHVAGCIVAPEQLPEAMFEAAVSAFEFTIEADRPAFSKLTAELLLRWNDPRGADALDAAANEMEAAGRRSAGDAARRQPRLDRFAALVSGLFITALAVKVARRRAVELRAAAAESNPQTTIVPEEAAAVA